MYKIDNGLSPDFMIDFINDLGNQRPIWSNCNVPVQFLLSQSPNGNIWSKTIQITGPRIWRIVPDEPKGNQISQCCQREDKEF